MDNVKLSRRTRKLLSRLCREYRKRLNRGKSNMEARLMGAPDTIRADIAPRWSLSEVICACDDLAMNGLVETCPGDDEPQFIILSYDAVAWDEEYSANLRKTLLEEIRNILALLKL